MLPAPIRFWLFDKMSSKTMRYVSAVPERKADGLTKQVYRMIREDFFRNGSLTSRSRVPELLAAIWTAGREAMLVEDKVDRTVKDAICAVLSQLNDCPYCEDMLVSLVHAGGSRDAAMDIFSRGDLEATDDQLRRYVEWLQAVASPEENGKATAPFSCEQAPEVFGTLMAMSDINRFSHVVMAESPVSTPLGVKAAKALQLRLFGSELVPTRRVPLEPGRSLPLLPTASLPDDLKWATPNPRVADALSRWVAAVERETDEVISHAVRRRVAVSLDSWQGETMPLSRAWVEVELDGLSEEDQAVARLAIVLAKAPYQVDEKLAEAVLGEDGDEARFVRILAWASFVGARRFANLIAGRTVYSDAEEVEITPLAVQNHDVGLVA